MTDAKGQCVPDAKHKIGLTISGPAKLVGFGSANPFAQPGFQSSEAETFDGRALAILKADGTPGLVQHRGAKRGAAAGFDGDPPDEPDRCSRRVGGA